MGDAGGWGSEGGRERPCDKLRLGEMECVHASHIAVCINHGGEHNIGLSNL
jgi:hypothetical protein